MKFAFTRRDAARFALAAAFWRFPRIARAADGETETHGLSSFGELALPAGFQAFRLCEPGCPEGRHLGDSTEGRGRQPEFRHLRHAQHPHLQGRRRGRHGRDLRHPDERGRRRARIALRARGARVRISADKLTYRFLLRPEARFHDGSRLTAHDVAFSLMTLKQKGHPTERVVLDADAGRGSRERRRRSRHPFRQAQPRPASRHRLPADLLGGLLEHARLRGLDARSAARLRALTRSDASSTAASSNSIASPIIGARTCRVNVGINNFEHDTLRILPRPASRLRGLQGRQDQFPGGISPRASGRRATISRPSATAASRRRSCRTASRSAPQGWYFNIAPRRCSRTRAFARRSGSPSTSNGPTRTSCIRSTSG